MYMGFLGGPSDKESTCNAAVAGDMGLIPGLGSSPGGGHGKPASILAWKISRTKEPGGLQSIGLQSRPTLTEATEQSCTHNVSN